MVPNQSFSITIIIKKTLPFHSELIIICNIDLPKLKWGSGLIKQFYFETSQVNLIC